MPPSPIEPPARRTPRITRRRLLSVAVVCSLSWIGIGIAFGNLDEDTVKAGFLYNFAQFSEWPKSFSSTDPFTLCVEDGSLSPSVVRGLAEEKINGNRLSSKIVPSPVRQGDILACDLLFVGDSAPNAETIVGWARLSPTLLVSDREGFARQGGHIELFRANRNLRFRVNLRTLQTSGVTISSKVLRLAEIVQ